MTTQTSHNLFANLPEKIRAVLPKGEDLYDALMGPIDLDLITANIPTLDEKYKTESTTERKSRMSRYVQAYTCYQRTVQKFFDDLESLVIEHKNALAETERRNDATTAESIEKSFGA